MDSAADTTIVQGRGGRVLLLPFPGMQGHANPMLQLGSRLAYHGLRPTLVLTRYVLSTTTASCPFPVVAISDGFDAGGIASCGEDTAEYLRRMEAAGSDTLARLLHTATDVRVLVYDSHLPWARRVARDAGVAAAAFMTQMCAVDAVYGEAFSGRVALPLEDGSGLLRRGVLGVDLGPDDVPPFVANPAWYPAFTESALAQFDGLEKADDVLVNSFRDLEPKEADYMESRWRAKTIGPTLPSFYLDDDRLPLNKSYGFNLVSNPAPCMAWLDKQPPCSVVLASYGTVANLDTSQLEELGYGLCNSGHAFLWVLRSDEAQKLSEELCGKCNMKGQIVPFCPQLEVLYHRATGCFLTHCGWNSTTEAIVTGVPMVAIPQWADQPITAKYVESAWGIGLRARRDDKGLVRREEVERCIKGEKSIGEMLLNGCKRQKKRCGKEGALTRILPILQPSCFLTHRGWNSTTEAIATGIPIVAIPQWEDQPTTAKYVESSWGIGLRARRDDKGFVRREEVERCIKEVMGGDEYRSNASKWMQKAKETMREGGSSDKNIADFVAKYLSN